jgi:hypothetical protein
MRGVGTVGVVLMLAGCASAPSVSCPPLVAYSLAQQSTLAAELPADGLQTQIQIEDYLKLRQACRIP